MVKGAMVVIMLITHASNLFLEIPSLRYLIYPVLFGCISGGWIFISGFLISNHYQTFFEENVGATSRRLVVRGLRILALFLVTNLLLGKISVTCDWSAPLDECQPWRLLVLGDNAGMTFEILQGIAYVSMVAPFYMAMPKVATAGIVFMVVVATVAAFLGFKAEALSWMLLVGLAGVALGWYIPAEKLRQLVTDPSRRRVAAICAAAAWGAYHLVANAGGYARTDVAAYIVGVAGILLLLYVSNGWLNWRGAADRYMNLMARYALFSYVGQMAILWTLHYLTAGVPLLHSYPVGLFGGLFLLLGSLELLDVLRRRSRWINGAYQWVFG